MAYSKSQVQESDIYELALEDASGLRLFHLRQYPLRYVVELARKMKKLANDDPRKIIHSNKVGLSLTMVLLN